MYCRKCGREIKDISRFCPYCGQETHININQKRYKETKKQGKQFLLLVLVIVPVVIIAAIYSLVSDHIKSLPENRIANTWYLCYYTDLGWIIDDDTFLEYDEDGRWYSSEGETGDWRVVGEIIKMQEDDGIDGMVYFGAPAEYAEEEVQDLIQYTNHGDILTLRTSDGDEKIFAACDWIS